ncbi:MAG: hypothetical protein ACOC3V_04610 [bacterium]
MVEIIYSEYRRARKPHKCFGCGETIEIGDIFLREVDKDGGTLYTVNTCRFCRWISHNDSVFSDFVGYDGEYNENQIGEYLNERMKEIFYDKNLQNYVDYSTKFFNTESKIKSIYPEKYDSFLCKYLIIADYIEQYIRTRITKFDISVRHYMEKIKSELDTICLILTNTYKPEIHTPTISSYVSSGVLIEDPNEVEQIKYTLRKTLVKKTKEFDKRFNLKINI